jgi:hypothetical protein
MFRNFKSSPAFYLSLTLASLSAYSASASILTSEPSGKTIENVAIAKSATAKIADRNLTLQTVGAGLRSKRVAVVNVKVYVTQLMLSDSTHYVRTDAGALDSAATSPSSALRLDFLRSVDAQTVQLAFRDSLIANQVDLNDTGIKAFLDAVSAGGDAAQGKALTIVLEHLPTGQEAVTYEDNAGKATTVVSGQGLVRKILSIWLGKPADSGLNNLKKSLIEGN